MNVIEAFCTFIANTDYLSIDDAATDFQDLFVGVFADKNDAVKKAICNSSADSEGAEIERNMIFFPVSSGVAAFRAP